MQKARAGYSPLHSIAQAVGTYAHHWWLNSHPAAFPLLDRQNQKLSPPLNHQLQWCYQSRYLEHWLRHASQYEHQASCMENESAQQKYNEHCPQKPFSDRKQPLPVPHQRRRVGKQIKGAARRLQYLFHRTVSWGVHLQPNTLEIEFANFHHQWKSTSDHFQLLCAPERPQHHNLGRTQSHWPQEHGVCFSSTPLHRLTYAQKPRNLT